MTAPPRVLIVDDEPEILSLMGDFLEADGFDVSVAEDADQARARLAAESIDCVLLDVMLPGTSGFELCRELRGGGSDQPVIFLTARDSDLDRIRGLQLGGDDYVSKSAMPLEVVARVRAVLRRARPKVAARRSVLELGPLCIDIDAHVVTLAGQDVSLTAKEFALLRFLVENPGRALTRDQLYEHVWGGEWGDRHTVSVHISRLREKIEADPERPRLIVTIRSVGYRFEPPR